MKSGTFQKQLTFSKYKLRENLKQGKYFYWGKHSWTREKSFIMILFQIYHYDTAFQTLLNIIETEKHVGWCVQLLMDQNQSKQRTTFANQEFYFQQTCQ